MPKKNTIQPEPLETFKLEDGTTVEIRDYETREKGPGKDKQWKARNQVDCILTGILDMIQGSNNEQIKSRRSGRVVKQTGHSGLFGNRMYRVSRSDHP